MKRSTRSLAGPGDRGETSPTTGSTWRQIKTTGAPPGCSGDLVARVSRGAISAAELAHIVTALP